MQTKKDQLQAHNFVVGRLKSALLRGDADAIETPTRRFSAAGFAGVLIAALLVAGCGVLGLISPGKNKAWREPGTVVVEKETGARYLYLDGELRPVLNLASARLLVGTAIKVRTVSAKSLRGVPHGLAIGIPGAPDSLPAPAAFTGAPWLVCATTTAGISGEPRPTITVYIGGIAPVSPLDANAAAHVVTPDGTTYLVWADRRLRAVDRTPLVAFSLEGVRQIPVAAAWVNALPQGPDLSPPAVPQRGAPGPAVDGRPTRVGQVVAVDKAVGGRDFYAVVADGLVPLSPVTAALVLADPDTRGAYGGAPVRAVVVGADAVVAAKRSAVTLDPAGLPATLPKPVDPTDNGRRILCGRHNLGEASSVQVVLAESGPGSADGASDVVLAGPMVADRVGVAAGSGVLARAQPAPGVPGQTLYLVTDVGIKYPLPSASVASALGYGAVPPVDVPASLLAFLPTGPALDPARAGVTYAGSGAAGPAG